MRGWSDSIQALTTASNADILSPHCSLSKPLNLYTLISFQMSQNSSSRCATHTQRQFFRSQTLLYHPHPHFSIFSLVHLHLTFSSLVCLLALWGQQEPCPFTTRLRVLKLGCRTSFFFDKVLSCLLETSFLVYHLSFQKKRNTLRSFFVPRAIHKRNTGPIS